MGFDPITMVLVASAAISTVSSLKQAKLAKKQAAIEQQQYEEDSKWATKMAKVDKENLSTESEFVRGRNLASAASLGYVAYSSGSYLANRNYNQFQLDRTLNQIDEQLAYKKGRYALSSRMSSIRGQYNYIGAIGNAVGTIASTTYKINSLQTPENKNYQADQQWWAGGSVGNEE